MKLDPPSAISLRFTGRRIVKVLTVTVATLIVLSVVALGLRLYTSAPSHPLGAKFIYWFNTDVESNVPALFSGFLLLIAAALLAVIALSVGAQKRPYRRHWWALSLIFVYLACDEVGQLHERLSASLPATLEEMGIQTPAWMYWAWVGPALIIVAILGITYARMVFSLRPVTRNLFILSGAIFVGGALGLEMYGGYLESKYGRGAEVLIESLVEEAMEMTGVTLFIYALVRHLRERVTSIHVEVPSLKHDLPSDNPSEAD